MVSLKSRAFLNFFPRYNSFIMENMILDFTNFYKSIPIEDASLFHYIDCTDIESCSMYVTKEALAKISARIFEYTPTGIHFLDNGNYHYVTELFLKKISEPFSLILFDHHTDMQEPLIHELLSCGSWVRDALQTIPNLKFVDLIGPDIQNISEFSKEFSGKVRFISASELSDLSINLEQAKMLFDASDLPVYISIDKDVLSSIYARTNWNQGDLSLSVLKALLNLLFEEHRIIGADICGENDVNESASQLISDLRINQKTDEILFRYLSDLFEKYLAKSQR